MSALQQGAGVQDGVAEEEGTVELGLKRLWKVGHESCIVGDMSSPGQEVVPHPALFSRATAQLKFGASSNFPTSLSFFPHPICREIYRILFSCPVLCQAHKVLVHLNC